MFFNFKDFGIQLAFESLKSPVFKWLNVSSWQVIPHSNTGPKTDVLEFKWSIFKWLAKSHDFTIQKPNTKSPDKVNGFFNKILRNPRLEVS